MATGVFNSQQLPQDLASKSFSSLITRLAPNGAPLFVLTSMAGKEETANQIEHGYFSKTMVFPSMTMAAAAVAGDTTLTVVSTANVVPGQIYRVSATGENFIVNTVASTTSVTVTRAVGTVAAGAIANGAVVYMVGNAYEEGSLRPTALAIDAVRNTNYTQIIRNSWAITDTLRATLMAAGDGAVAENKRDCAQFHAVDIEKTILFGQKYLGTRNGQPFHTAEGLIANVTANAPTNITTLGATTNYTQLENAIDPVFNQRTDMSGDNERVMFCGGQALRVINQIGRLNGTYQLVGDQTSFGLRFSTLKLTRGTVRLVEHPLLSAHGLGNAAIVVDVNTLALAYMNGRKTQHRYFGSILGKSEEITTDNGIDGGGGTLTTEFTPLFKNPKANAVIYNFTAAAAG